MMSAPAVVGNSDIAIFSLVGVKLIFSLGSSLMTCSGHESMRTKIEHSIMSGLWYQQALGFVTYLCQSLIRLFVTVP